MPGTGDFTLYFFINEIGFIRQVYNIFNSHMGNENHSTVIKR